MVALELEIFTDMLQRLEEVSGEVRVSFRKQDIVRVSKDGNMVIDTKGVRGVSLAPDLLGAPQCFSQVAMLFYSNKSQSNSVEQNLRSAD